ncbi:MAG: hypothetical protein JNM96_01080, partial [Bacteroidia bacterium]|nr:hypothetical protein [Bacteroidia bacterium]
KVIPGILPSKTNQVLKITVINNDNLLLANSEGLTIYNITNKTTENIQEIEYNKSKFEVKRINAAFIDSKNNWWLRTSKGLLVYNRNTSFAKLFEHSPNNPNSLISNTILDINELKSGEIILGTIIGFSILKDLEKGVFKNFPKSSSFKNSVVYSVIPDKEGNVWMTTNFGIYIFNPTNETFICFDSESGGFINEYNSGSFYFDQNNTMILGGIGGVVEANPNKIFTKVDTLPIYTTLYYNGKNNFINTFSESNKVTLNYNNSEIEFQFDLPYYFNNNLDIQYKIEEANSNWQNIGTNQFLRQENLASGKYTFQFRVEDKTGRIKFKEVSYVVIVKPPFWYAGWFYLLLVVLISAVFYIFYKTRLNRKINRLKEIENVRFEENEKVRKAAAMDLHDEFGNGLTRISMLVEVAKVKLPPESKDVLSYLNTISESSGRLYQGTKDFIWSINPNNETLFETIIRIKDYADEIFTGTGTLFELTGPSDELKQIKNTPSVNRNITMIFKESLSNTLKHAGAKEVKLIIQLNDKDFFITLKDNGKGFDVNKTKGGFGLGNIKLRAKKIDAEIEFKSEIGVGTELILKHKI